MTDKETVLRHHPEAFSVFNADTGTFRIYANRRGYVALSASVEGESAAWADALHRIRERQAAAGTYSEAPA